MVESKKKGNGMSFKLRRTAIISIILLITTLVLVPRTIPVMGLTLRTVVTIEQIVPEISGLTTKVLSDHSGRLCITNNTPEEILILNLEGTPSAKLDPHQGQIIEYSPEAGWTKYTKDEYCFLPAPLGPREQSSYGPWTVQGQVGNKPFKIVGRTEYTVPSTPTSVRILDALFHIGAAMCGLIGLKFIISGFSCRHQHKPAVRYFLIAFLLLFASASFVFLIIISSFFQ
jgi:hypothetical protein